MHEIIAGKLTLKKQNTTGVLIEPSDKFKKHIKNVKLYHFCNIWDFWAA